MGRLRAALRDTYATRGQEINIHTPRNCEPLTLTFQAERMVKVGLLLILPFFTMGHLRGFLHVDPLEFYWDNVMRNQAVFNADVRLLGHRIPR